MSIDYKLKETGEFIIEDYDKAKTFASFLPGIAGIDGIPMWSFYVNRGQCMGSFGVRDKNGTIMEFFPANLLYKNIELQGFRTFIKLNGEVHEIFSSLSKDDTSRRMAIEKNLIWIEEVNNSLGIIARVTYFTMPGESFAAIVRKVEVENLGGGTKEIELLDGLTQILPFGIGNESYQSMANLSRAWFGVFNMENNIPYYRLRATMGDTVEIGEVNKGNFYLSFSSESEGLLPVIFDMDVIFGPNTSLTCPSAWDCNIEMLYRRKQVPVNKVSGGFTGIGVSLKEKFTLCTVIGHIASEELINNRKADFNIEYIEKKEKEARELADSLVDDVRTKTSSNLFDKYVSQCYLDNILRGGYPLFFNAGSKKHVYHVYSRKHGDTEREYNFFSLEPAFYSQGNGNFRDINQNRRNDVLFNPEVGDFNVKHFMNLIQIDGYNPLGVKGTTFSFDKEYKEKILEMVLKDEEEIENILDRKFTPGQLITYISDKGIPLKVSGEELLKEVLAHSKQNFEAEFGEGYWVDHWTYNMDLIDTLLKVYPDKLQSFVFEDGTYRFFDSAARVLPRLDKYVLAGGKVRQYGSILEDEEKCHKLNISLKGTNWLRTQYGTGSIYETNLYVKLVSLALNKFVTMDPQGIGIEMEANKPGWNDAMNGLPGLFGSGVSETAELKRVVEFILQIASQFDEEVSIPVEIADLLTGTEQALTDHYDGRLDDYGYWDRTSGLREDYRERTRWGIDGREQNLASKEIMRIFQKIKDKIDKGLEKALVYGEGIYPTFLTFEAKKYEVIEGKTSPINGYQNVRVTEFECRPLPLFLEGPARVLKTMKDMKKAEELYSLVKNSEMYDRKLKMYKTSVPLEAASLEIGRVKAFTPGWLEREAVFLHMEYKYILSLLKAGLYEQYYEDIKNVLTAFLDPAVYGRSTLENSSFIASSANPDETMHGRGFQARLSGSTAEMLSIWFTMMVGHKVFTYEEGMLQLSLNPILPGWLFDEQGKVSFRFLGYTEVTYHNSGRRNTYGEQKVDALRTTIKTNSGETVEFSGNVISGKYAELIRSRGVKTIDIYFNK
ncbi:MAG: cellobiose phosphorylase [Bacillota bacterium]|nr:cellobiose phosphorylase [Bacillota bacterium]